MEEKELVAQSKQGDQEAFGILVRKYERKVFNLAFSLIRNRDLADDLSQEVFIKAYYALDRFQLKSKFGTWLYRIALNHIRDFFRKKKRVKLISFEKIKENLLCPEEDPLRMEREQMEEQRRRLVHEALTTLPEKHRVILSLRDIQGFSYGEIAEILGLSPGTVDSRLHRARKMLKKKLEPFLSR